MGLMSFEFVYTSIIKDIWEPVKENYIRISYLTDGGRQVYFDFGLPSTKSQGGQTSP